MLRKTAFCLLVFLMSTPLVFAEDSIESLMAKGNAWLQKKEYDKAIGEYEQALKLNEKNVVIHLVLGLAYANAKQADKAIEHATRAVELDPNYYSYYNLGLVHASNEEAEKAIEAFDKAIEKSPGSYQAYYQKGLMYTSLKEYEKALEAHNHAIELNAYFAVAYLASAGPAYRLGKRDEVMKQIEKLKSIGRIDLAVGLEKWVQDQDKGANAGQPQAPAS